MKLRLLYMRRQSRIFFLVDYKTLFTRKTSIYKALLHDSNNLVAESLVLMISGISQWELNTQQGLVMLSQQNKALKRHFQQVDGSGLSRYNLVYPKALLRVLISIFDQIGLSRIKTLFPQANSEGTLLHYAPQQNMGFIYAKSGSLRNNHVLAGYFLSVTNKPFAFVISVNKNCFTTNFTTTQNIHSSISNHITFF